MLGWSSLLTTPYRHPPDRWSTRWVIRGTLLALGHLVQAITGADRLRRQEGPFVAALNHSQHTEAFLVPALLAWLRGGRVIRFLADWNYMLLPPVYVLYKSARVIPVTSKSARPRVLNALRDLVAPPPNGYDCTRLCLERGQPVGFFVEGTTNPHPNRLLHGHTGAARLSLEMEVPVLPIGIRFPASDRSGRRISEGAPLSVHVAPPMTPPSKTTVSAWHARVMRSVAAASDTTWSRSHPRRPVGFS